MLFFWYWNSIPLDTSSPDCCGKSDNNNSTYSLTNSLIALLLKILMAELNGPFDRLRVEVRCCWLWCSEGQLQT